MSPKGRPTSDPKRNETRIRLSDEQLRKLTVCCEKTGMTKADVIRKGIDLVYEQVK
jgi:predicted DNA-binding protein